MAWVKFSDNFPQHPKINALSNETFRLHIEAMCHANQFLTGGAISSSTADGLATTVIRHLQIVMRARNKEFALPTCTDLIEELVTAKVWDRAKNGFAIHDYHKYQPPREELDARRVAISAMRSDLGKKGAAARWGDGKQDGKQGESEGADGPIPEGTDGKMAKPMANADTSSFAMAKWQTDAPVPVPVLRPSLKGKGESISEEGGRRVSAAPPRPAGPVFQTSGKMPKWQADSDLINDLTRLYPNVDVPHEMDLAASKIRTKAVTMKTPKGMPKFLHSWMERVQNRAHGGNGKEPAPTGNPKIRSLAEVLDVKQR